MTAINNLRRAGPVSTDPRGPILPQSISTYSRLTCQRAETVRQDEQMAICVARGYVHAVLCLRAGLRAGSRLADRAGWTCCDRRCRAQHVRLRRPSCRESVSCMYLRTCTVHVPIAPPSLPPRPHCDEMRDAMLCDAMGSEAKRPASQRLGKPSKVAQSQINFGGSRLRKVLPRSRSLGWARPAATPQHVQARRHGTWGC